MWWRKQKDETPKAEMQELGAGSDLDALFKQDCTVLFKHSTACPVSWVAHGQMTRFLAARPETAVHMVNVIKNRPVSQEIARRTGVVHESPQVIVLNRGIVVDAISHGDITQTRLEALLKNG